MWPILHLVKWPNFNPKLYYSTLTVKTTLSKVVFQFVGLGQGTCQDLLTPVASPAGWNFFRNQASDEKQVFSLNKYIHTASQTIWVWPNLKFILNSSHPTEKVIQPAMFGQNDSVIATILCSFVFLSVYFLLLALTLIAFLKKLPFKLWKVILQRRKR
jgi:hypothetical protein